MNYVYLSPTLNLITKIVPFLPFYFIKFPFISNNTQQRHKQTNKKKEQIQKLAGQIEFMRIVQMEVNNRHLKPKPGGYFSMTSPIGKSLTASRKHHQHASSAETSKHENSVIEDGHSGTNSLSGGVR